MKKYNLFVFLALIAACLSSAPARATEFDLRMRLTCTFVPNNYTGWRTEVQRANAVESGASIDIELSENSRGVIVRSNIVLDITFAKAPRATRWNENIRETHRGMRARVVNEKDILLSRQEHTHVTTILEQVDLESPDNGRTYNGRIYFDGIEFTANCRQVMRPR